MQIEIPFTPAEKEAVLHRLTLWDCFSQVFADTEGLEHLADAVDDRVRTLCLEYEASSSPFKCEDTELDREIMVDAIEGNTWYAVHTGDADVSNQKLTAVERALRGAAAKIAAAFKIPLADIEVPLY